MKKTSSAHGRTVLTEPIYEAIKVRIMEQDFPPESRLNIDALATELKVSPTPIREALARLAAERLVIFEPYKGYSVSPPLTPRELADLMHVRGLLETDAVRLAATRIVRPDLLALEKTLAELTAHIKPAPEAQSYLHFNQLDRKFHEIMVGAADNRFLLESYRALNVHVQLARFYRQYGNVALHATVEEHRAIYQALADHDPVAAVAAVHCHLNAADVRAYGLLDAQTTLLEPAAFVR